MRKIVLLVALGSCIASCSTQPKCGDENVLKLATKIFADKITDKLVEEDVNEKWYSSNEYKDAYAYAEELNYNVSEYVQQAKEKYVDSVRKDAILMVKRISLKNIRTVSIDEKILQCDCSAEVESKGMLMPIEVEYSAQKTEDKGNPLYVELIYNVKK